MCIIVTKFDLLKRQTSTPDIYKGLKKFLPNFIHAANSLSSDNLLFLKSYVEYPFDYSQEDYQKLLTWLAE
jgi:hypothetical protein